MNIDKRVRDLEFVSLVLAIITITLLIYGSYLWIICLISALGCKIAAEMIEGGLMD